MKSWVWNVLKHLGCGEVFEDTRTSHRTTVRLGVHCSYLGLCLTLWPGTVIYYIISHIQVCCSLSSSVRLLQDSDNMINVSSLTHIWYMSLSKQEWACCCFYHYSYYEYETWLAHGYWGKSTSNSWSTFALNSGLNASWKLDQYILPALLFPARVTWLITGFLLPPFLRKLKMWCCSCLLCKALKPMGEAALTS